MEESKIYILADDKYYEKGVKTYLSFNPKFNSKVTVIKRIEELPEKKENLILITDGKVEKKELNFSTEIYELVETENALGNKICKYTNFEEILSRFIKESFDSKDDKLDIYTVSSTSSKSGKSLIGKELAEILVKRGNTAYFEPISKTENYHIGLSEILLMFSEGGKISDNIQRQENGVYMIPPFKLLRDYMELDKDELISFFKKIKNELNISYFVIEVPDIFSKSAEELIRISDTHIIIKDCSQIENLRELQLLREYSSSVLKTIELKNFSRFPQNINELPIIREISDIENSENSHGFYEDDYNFFKYRLEQNLEV